MATHTARIAPKTVLARFESKSKPGHFHEVRLGADAVMYCTCNAWRFQKVNPSHRTCCHTEAAVAQISHGRHTLRSQPAPKQSSPPVQSSFWTLL